MSIETKAKELVKLHKRKQRLEKQLETLNESITAEKQGLKDIFEGLGLNSSFSQSVQE